MIFFTLIIISTKVLRHRDVQYLKLILWRHSFDHLKCTFTLGIVYAAEIKISVHFFLRHPLSPCKWRPCKMAVSCNSSQTAVFDWSHNQSYSRINCGEDCISQGSLTYVVMELPNKQKLTQWRFFCNLMRHICQCNFWKEVKF